MKKGTYQGRKWLDRKEPIHLYRLAETKVRNYGWKRLDNPYLKETPQKMKVESPFSYIHTYYWSGRKKRNSDLRVLCYQRDDGVCQICQRPKTNLVAHHIIPLYEIGEEAETLDNLITICKDCEREHFRELHQEIRTPEGVMQLGGSRVRRKVQARLRREGDWKHARYSDLPS